MIPINKKDRLAYIATDMTITVILDGRHRTVQVRNKQQKLEVISALEKFKKSMQTQFDMDALELYLQPIRRAVLASDNRFEVSANGKVLYLAGTTVPIPKQLGDHILEFLENKLPVDALVKFWESCLRNPHYVAIQELFNFLEENKLPITDDGGFLGYKKLNFVRGVGRIDVPDEFEELTVNEAGQVISVTGGIVVPSVSRKYKQFIDGHNIEMVDVHSGTIRQRVGEVVKIDRVRLGEEERRQECGYGLHIGAYSYSFGGNVRVLCKVFPEDVIACNEGQAKLRTCKYQIISFVDEAKKVKEIYCNLQGDEKDIAEGSHDIQIDEEEDDSDNPFVQWEEVVCHDAGTADGLEENSYYTIISICGDEVMVINEYGEKEWYHYSHFTECKD